MIFGMVANGKWRDFPAVPIFIFSCVVVVAHDFLIFLSSPSQKAIFNILYHFGWFVCFLLTLSVYGLSHCLQRQNRHG